MNELRRPEAGEIILEMPGANRAALTKDLAEQFRDLSRRAKKNLVEMALLAHGVREANKNASNELNKNFHDWYSHNKMDEVFGSKSNFSKYASAGRVIVRHRDILAGRIEQLPLSLSALYVAHDMTEDEARLCMEDNYSRTDASVTDLPLRNSTRSD